MKTYSINICVFLLILIAGMGHAQCVMHQDDRVDPGDIQVVTFSNGGITASGSYIASLATSAILNFSIPNLEMSVICSGTGCYASEDLLVESSSYYLTDSATIKKATPAKWPSCDIISNTGYSSGQMTSADSYVYYASRSYVLCRTNFIDPPDYWNPGSPYPESFGLDQYNGNIFVASNTWNINFPSIYIFSGLSLISPSAPTQTPYFPAISYAYDVAVWDRFAYVVADENNSVTAIDIGDPPFPKQIDQLPGPGGPCGNIILDVPNCVAYAACANTSQGPPYSDHKLTATDISDPYALEMLCSYGTTERNNFDLAVSFPYAALAQGAGGLELVDISEVHALVDLVSPTDAATKVNCGTTLEWTPKTSSVLNHYDLYFGTAANPPLLDGYITNPTSGTGNVQYSVATNPATTYYWKVVAHMKHCGKAESEIWSFDTKAAPAAFDLVRPLNGASAQSYSALALDWTDSVGADTYDLYFGTSYPPPLYQAGLTVSTFTVGPLSPSTIHYWKVVAKNPCETSSPIWTFATMDNGSGDRRLGPSGEYIISIVEGTTAGGAEISIFSDASRGGVVFANSTKVFFDDGRCVCQADPCYPGGPLCSDGDGFPPLASYTGYVPPITQVINDRTLLVTTPRYFEVGTTILINQDGLGFSCSDANDIVLGFYPAPSCAPAYTFHTLAYTANQVSQNLSVVDTVANGIFSGASSIPFATPVTPMAGMAYATGNRPSPARRLYLVDYYSGNLSYFDIANFRELGTLRVQSPGQPLYLPGAFDVAFSAGGEYAFVSHITSGSPIHTLRDAVLNPVPGGVSVIGIDGTGNPSVYDVDEDVTTTSPGAPEGISRIAIGPGVEYFYPLSIKAVGITQDVGSYAYRDGEKWPGEYIFVSGLGEAEWGCTLATCIPGLACYCVLAPRPAMVAIIDNNDRLCHDRDGQPGCESWDPNPDYWRNLRSAYRVMGDGIVQTRFGQTSLGLGFSLTSGMPDTGDPLGPTVYVVSEQQDSVSLLHYDAAAGDWAQVMEDGTTHPLIIQTGDYPTAVKVQFVDPYTYAYITNAGDDTVYAINTAYNTLSGFMDQKECDPEVEYFATSMDARSKGDWGYSADYGAGTVSVFDLPAMTMFDAPDGCNIPVGEAPIRIVVQPVPDAGEIFGGVRNSLAFARPTDFTTPSKQGNLIADWERMHALQETSAAPKAVVANIDNFQKNAGKWVTDADLKKSVDEGVNLYRAAYIYDHPSK